MHAPLRTFRVFCAMQKEKQAVEQRQTVENIVKRIEALGFVVSPMPQLSQFDGDFFLLNGEILIALDYAHLSYRRDFVFSFDKKRFEYCFQNHRHFFQLLICETSERVFIVPLSLILEIFSDIYSAGNDFKQFKPALKMRNGTWFCRFFGQYDITDYLNRYDFLITESKAYRPQPTRYDALIEVPTLEEKYRLIAEEATIRYDSLHASTVDMLRKIGEWSGYRVVTESYPLSITGFPYAIDCLWYKGDDLFIAIEVCHNGVVEKDKDALKLAKTHGARKVIIVTEISKMARVRKLFALEGDIKSWAEVWSFERVFSLFESGMRFFKDFEKFRRHGWQGDLGEFI